MTILAMLRHADTDWSVQGRIQGRSDVPLSEDGRRSLRDHVLADEFRAMRVVTSPLLRCVETAAVLGLAAVREDRLAEMRWGSWEGRMLSELRTELGESMRENEARGLDFTPPGGESPREVFVRVRGWLAEIAAEGAPTLAITHRGVIRVVYAAASNWDMRGRQAVKLDWRAIHVFRLDPTGMPGLLRMNVPFGQRTANAPTGLEK